MTLEPSQRPSGSRRRVKSGGTTEPAVPTPAVELPPPDGMVSPAQRASRLRVVAAQFQAAVGQCSFPSSGAALHITLKVPREDKVQALPLTDLQGMVLEVTVLRPPLYTELDYEGNYVGDQDVIEVEF